MQALRWYPDKVAPVGQAGPETVLQPSAAIMRVLLPGVRQ
jgi:hypothetical protein